MKYIKRHRLLTAEAIGLIALFWLAVVLEEKFAISVFWQFYGVMAGLALLFTLPSYLRGQRIKTLGLFLGFNAAVLVLHFLVLNPVKPFTQFYHDIRPGMTLEQVKERFNQRFPIGGKFRPPQSNMFQVSADTTQDNQPYLVDQPNHAISYQLDPTDGRYDAELLVVYLKEGNVVGTRYLPD